MKFLKGLLLLWVICTSLSNVFAQSENYKWVELPKPNGTSSGVTGNLSSIEVSSNGTVYFIYYDNSNYSLEIKKLDMINNSWTSVYTDYITGQFFSTLQTYQAGGDIFIALAGSNTPNNFFVYKFEPQTSSTTNLFVDALSSIGPAGLYDIVVDENTNMLYSAAADDGDSLFLDRYNLNDLTVGSTVSLGTTIFQNPTIAIDEMNNELLVVGNQSLGEYTLLKSPIQQTLNFQPFDGNTGEISSSLYPSPSIGDYVNLIEKESSSPDVVLTHDTGTIYENFRSGVLNANTDANIVPSSSLNEIKSAGANESTFTIGLDVVSSEVVAYDVRQDGSVIQVAANNDPIINSLHGEGFVFNVTENDRLITFYHDQIEGDGGFGGRFMLTNNPPSMTYNVGTGCNGTYSYIVEDISFTDLDGDYVELLYTNIESSDSSIIHPSDIFLLTDKIEAQANSTGSVDLTFQYTDGLDTISEVITITVTEPQTVDFNVSEITACVNDGSIDLNDFVSEPGGSFSFNDYSFDDGVVDLNDLAEFETLPYTDIIYYYTTDENGCSISADSEPVFELVEAPTAELNVVNTTCGNTDGEIEAININSPNGGYYTYWNTGDQNTNTVSNLSTGAYYFNLVDDKDCKFTAQANISASDFAVTGTVTNPSCHDYNDGSIDIEIFGGSGSYSVLWSTGQSINDLTNLEAGNYVITVTDDDGCQISESFNLENPEEFNIEYYASQPTNCGTLDGSIGNFNTEGGTPPFTFEWSDGSTNQDLNNVGQGYYEVTVTDNNECVAEDSYFLNAIEAPYVSLDKKVNSSCTIDDGSLDIYVSPALGEQITGVEWSNGATTEDISNLSPGLYECTVYQSNGCNATYSWTIENKPSSKPEICIVTVDTTTNSNLVVWQKDEDNSENIDHYNIYRETSNVGQYQKIDTVNRSSISVFNDVVASPENRSWRYKISAVNECGVESNLSSSHKTIHLTIDDMGNGENFIAWDNYEGFEYQTYNLWRFTEETGWINIEPNIAVEDTPNTTDTPPSNTGLDYVIEVVPPGGTCTATEGKAQDYNSSRSNKPNTGFNPGEGTGDPNNSLAKEENESYSVAVYPNPSDGLLEIAVYQKNDHSKLDLSVMDLNGKIIQENNLSEGVNYMDFSHLDAGIYVLNISDNNNSETFRVVIK